MPRLPAHIRARGEIRASFARIEERTSQVRVHQTGGLRLRLPRVSQGCEAVIINTGGGIAGGDSQMLSFDAGPGAHVTFTTQSAEKLYRAQADPAQVAVSLTLAPACRMEWLPQETILFDGSALFRALSIDMAENASLLMVESLIFGRLAMGESCISARLRDSWRIRRGGRMVFAEELAFGDADALDRPALGGGARCAASLLLVAPGAEAHLDGVRAAMAGAGCEIGVSGWNGMLLMRAISSSPERVRAAIVAALFVLRGRQVPRVWQM